MTSTSNDHKVRLGACLQNISLIFTVKKVCLTAPKIQLILEIARKKGHFCYLRTFTSVRLTRKITFPYQSPKKIVNVDKVIAVFIILTFYRL